MINLHEKKYNDTNFITGLRAIAVLLVFLIHCNIKHIENINDFLKNLISYGGYGVQIFFVISGFTIFYQLYEKNYSFKKFIYLRITRISLVYFPIIFFLFFLANLYDIILNDWANKFNNGIISIENLIVHLIYLGSFSLNYANTIIGVEWTLNIEVFYYFLIGLLISYNVIRNNLLNLFSFSLFFLLITVSFSLMNYFKVFNSQLINWMPFIYGYMFLFGGLSFHLRQKLQNLFEINKLKIISDISLIINLSLLLLLIYFHKNLPGIIVGAITAIITSSLIILTQDFGYFSKILTNKIIVFLGSISYSIYLVHFIIINSKISNFIGNGDILLNTIFDFSLTVIVSFFLFIVFETKIYNITKSLIVK